MLDKDAHPLAGAKAAAESQGAVHKASSAPRSTIPFPEPDRLVRKAAMSAPPGQLPRALAHELNNLLTVILGHAEFLLKRRESPENFQLRVAEIRNAAKRGLWLTNQLLASAGPRQPSR